MITGAQLRAARALLGWTQAKLADDAGIGLSTLRRIEASDGPIRAITENVWKIQRTLMEAGVLFLEDDDGGGIGVRFRRG